VTNVEPSFRTECQARDAPPRRTFAADRTYDGFVGLTRSLAATKRPSISVRENGRFFGTIYMESESHRSDEFWDEGWRELVMTNGAYLIANRGDF